MIIKKALEAYRNNLICSLEMLKFHGEDNYEKQIKDLQDKFDAYKAKKLEITNALAALNEELLKYE